jgi:hypothetical protein
LLGTPDNLLIAWLGRQQVAPSDQDRRFSFLLAAITLAALVPALVLGASEFISYDGYWHVFIAKQDQWKQFLFEYRRDAHPVLYQLLLRLTSSVLGNSRLAHRAASIIPSMASVYCSAESRKDCASAKASLC